MRDRQRKSPSPEKHLPSTPRHPGSIDSTLLRAAHFASPRKHCFTAKYSFRRVAIDGALPVPRHPPRPASSQRPTCRARAHRVRIVFVARTPPTRTHRAATLYLFPSLLKPPPLQSPHPRETCASRLAESSSTADIRHPIRYFLLSPDSNDDDGRRQPEAPAGRRPRRAGGARERPRGHRARALRRRRAQQQDQRDAGVRAAGEGEAAGGGRDHAPLHRRGQGGRRQEAVRGQGLGEGVGELQAAPQLRASRCRLR